MTGIELLIRYGDSDYYDDDRPCEVPRRPSLDGRMDAPMPKPEPCQRFWEEMHRLLRGTAME